MMKTHAVLRLRLGWALLDARLYALYTSLRIWLMNKKTAKLKKRISQLRSELEKPAIVVGPFDVQIHNGRRDG